MKKYILVGLLAAVTGAPLHATEIGAALPALQLSDQFGKPHKLDATTKRIYFTHDMAGGKLLKAVLGEKGQAVLDSQQAVAVTDVSAMPSMIRNMMAMPAMKKRSYQIWIDETGKAVSVLPRKPDQVTVIELDKMTIIAVQFAADEKNLKGIVAP